MHSYHRDEGENELGHLHFKALYSVISSSWRLKIRKTSHELGLPLRANAICLVSSSTLSITVWSFSPFSIQVLANDTSSPRGCVEFFKTSTARSNSIDTTYELRRNVSHRTCVTPFRGEISGYTSQELRSNFPFTHKKHS